MYWISNRDEANKLVQQAKETETKIKSHVIQEDETKKHNIYTEEDRQILDNIKITDLMNYEKATIIYSQTNLNEELLIGAVYVPVTAPVPLFRLNPAGSEPEVI